jgi:hypothetical protein
VVGAAGDGTGLQPTSGPSRDRIAVREGPRAEGGGYPRVAGGFGACGKRSLSSIAAPRRCFSSLGAYFLAFRLPESFGEAFC